MYDSLFLTILHRRNLALKNKTLCVEVAITFCYLPLYILIYFLQNVVYVITIAQHSDHQRVLCMFRMKTTRARNTISHFTGTQILTLNTVHTNSTGKRSVMCNQKTGSLPNRKVNFTQCSFSYFHRKEDAWLTEQSI